MDGTLFSAELVRGTAFPTGMFLKESGLPSQVGFRCLGTSAQLGFSDCWSLVRPPSGATSSRSCEEEFHPVALQAAD